MFHIEETARTWMLYTPLNMIYSKHIWAFLAISPIFLLKPIIDRFQKWLNEYCISKPYFEFDFFFVTYRIIQSIPSSEICALHLTHPSAHTPGAVGRCLAQGSHLSRGQLLPEPRFEPTTSGYKSNTLSIRLRLPHMHHETNQYASQASLSSHVYTLNACMRNNQSSGCRPKCCYNQSDFFPPQLSFNYRVLNRCCTSLKHIRYIYLWDPLTGALWIWFV